MDVRAFKEAQDRSTAVGSVHQAKQAAKIRCYQEDLCHQQPDADSERIGAPRCPERLRFRLPPHYSISKHRSGRCCSPILSTHRLPKLLPAHDHPRYTNLLQVTLYGSSRSSCKRDSAPRYQADQLPVRTRQETWGAGGLWSRREGVHG